MRDPTDAKLRFATLGLRRVLPSEHHELSPVVMPKLVAYGAEDRAAQELALALSELAEEGKPATVSRYLLPDGVRLEEIEVELGRGELPNRLGRPSLVTITVAIVPEPRPEATPAGHWVFIPAIEHACYVARTEDLATRVQDELRTLPSALQLTADGWKRLITYATTTLEPIEIELATTPFEQAQGRKAMAEAERKRQAISTLDGAGRRIERPATPLPLVGRDDLLGELSRALGGQARRSVLLVGEEAAGKSALALGWAAAHPDRKVWATSAAELVAGASGFGEWQARIAGVLAAAEALDAVLYFDDFGALFADRPAEGGVDLGAAMRRHVVDGRVRIVGELTAGALDRAERRDVSLVGAMLRVAVPPTGVPATIAACQAWAAHWAATQPARPQIAPAAVPAAVELAKRYLPYRAFPGKAVRLLEELRVAHDGGRDARGTGPVLGERELYAAFAWSTGIPLALLADDHALAQADVVASLRRRMIGQDTAVRRVADAICVAKARLAPADKPLASLLFVGPSGVGKTELARSVAAYLFGNADKMVRLDMSEYTDPWAAERLFGGASGDDGRLTAAVRSQPFGVVLLDEIEKAHPSVFDLLLQVLGEARLTDGRGRTTFFHNSIIVLTSNLGTRSAKGRLGLGPAETDEARDERRYRDAVLAAFRPELVNRLDQIVVFHALRADEIAKVAELAVSRLAERRGLTQSGVILDISPPALARIAELGYSPDLGARALRRHLDTAIVAPAARLLARAGTEGHGGTLTVRAVNEPLDRPSGARLGEEHGEVVVALWRRPSATGKRLVRSALALGEMRRDTDRELALPAAQGVRERIGELEATLATASKKATGRTETTLPGKEIARLASEHARLVDRWNACGAAQAELRTAEELCLEALARDIDAVDLIDAGIASRQRARRELFWLLTALREPAPGVTLLVHSPDARAAVAAWLELVLAASARLGWRAHYHVWGETAPHWSHPWGPPRDAAYAAEHLGAEAPAAVLVRVAGPGADLLLGLEAGMHRFHGLIGQPCHAFVDLLEPRTELKATEWAALPGPPAPRQPRGMPVREVVTTGDRTLVEGEDADVPWAELAARLEEAAVVRLRKALATEDGMDRLWKYESPDPAAGAAHAMIDFTIGVYAHRRGTEEEQWTSLTPLHFSAWSQGSSEVKLRDTMIDRLRDALRRAPPAMQELFQFPLGSELLRVPVELKLDAGRVTGDVPLIVEPRWVSPHAQRYVVYHPRQRGEWFLANDRDEIATLVLPFLRHYWAEMTTTIAQSMLSTGKDRLLTIAFSTEPQSLLDQVPSRKTKRTGAGAGGRRYDRVLYSLGVNESKRLSAEPPTGVPRAPYRERLQYLLGGPRPRAVAVIGPPGAGKTTLIQQWIADRLAEDGYWLHKNLDKTHKVFRISGKRLIAGMSYLGQWEERCLAVLEEARLERGILWVEDLHLWGRLGQSRQSERSFADFFRGPIRRGDLGLVADLTPEQYAQLERDAPALAEALAPVMVPAASAEETAHLLLHEVRAIETRLPVSLHPFVPRTALELGAALFPWRARPGVAIEIVRRVAAHGAAAGTKRDLTPRDVLEQLARTTGLAPSLLSLDEPLDAAAVEAAFAARVIGQAGATRAAADVILRVRAGLADPGRPVSVMLFTGPTGTGKTELATAIAEYLYGGGDRLVRIDMGELSGPDAVSRLIGDRWQPEGMLTSRVRAQPFSVVLLDEIEKAHPQALHLLLQLFDEGRLTDAAGDVASFASAVVIMTSNLGSKSAAPIGFGETRDRILADVAKAVRDFFPVELFNRIDRVVPFEPLTPEVAAAVVDKELAKLLGRRGLRERNTFVYAGAAVRRRAVADAFDPRYGARTVKRWLEDRIGGALTDLLASAPPARLRVVRLSEHAGAIQASLEPMAERAAEPGPYRLEGALDIATAALEPNLAEAAAALARIEASPLVATARREATGALAYFVEELQQRLAALTPLLGAAPAPLAEAASLAADARAGDADDDDDHEPRYEERPRGPSAIGRSRSRVRGSGAQARRAPASRDALVAAIAEAHLIERALPSLLDPDAHAVTVVVSRTGATADAGGLGIVVAALAQPAWVDAGASAGISAAAGRRGSIDEAMYADAAGAVHPLKAASALPRAATDVVLVLRGLFVRAALAGDHGTWMIRAQAAEPDVIRVEVRAGAPAPAATVLRAQLAGRAALERVLETGGPLPPNPDVILPVTRTLAYRPPLRPGEPYGVEIEDFSTGWVDRGTARELAAAIRRAWHLAWSRA